MKMECLDLLSVSWSKMWLHTRTDYKFGLSGFPLYEINMTTKSAKYSVINTIERMPTVKRQSGFEKKDKSQ